MTYHDARGTQPFVSIADATGDGYAAIAAAAIYVAREDARYGSRSAIDWLSTVGRRRLTLLAPAGTDPECIWRGLE